MFNVRCRSSVVRCPLSDVIGLLALVIMHSVREPSVFLVGADVRRLTYDFNGIQSLLTSAPTRFIESLHSLLRTRIGTMNWFVLVLVVLLVLENVQTGWVVEDEDEDENEEEDEWPGSWRSQRATRVRRPVCSRKCMRIFCGISCLLPNRKKECRQRCAN